MPNEISKNIQINHSIEENISDKERERKSFYNNKINNYSIY